MFAIFLTNESNPLLDNQPFMPSGQVRQIYKKCPMTQLQQKKRAKNKLQKSSRKSNR